jgi:hypothetical protein
MFIAFSGEAIAQSLSVTNSLSNAHMEVIMFAKCHSAYDPPCGLIGGGFELTEYGTSTNTIAFTDPCDFQTSNGWWSSIGVLPCPTIPIDFYWTDASLLIDFDGCGTGISVNVGLPTSSCLSSTESYTATGSVGSCTYTVTWTTAGRNVIITVGP